MIDETHYNHDWIKTDCFECGSEDLSDWQLEWDTKMEERIGFPMTFCSRTCRRSYLKQLDHYREARIKGSRHGRRT